MLEDNPHRCLLNSVNPATPFCALTTFYFCALSPSLPAAIVFCLSFRFTIGSFSLAHSLFAFLCLSECKEGIRQWPQYSRCTPAVRAGTAEMAVPVLWPAAPGYTWRGEITGGWSAQSNESADHDPVCSFVSVRINPRPRSICELTRLWILMAHVSRENLTLTTSLPIILKSCVNIKQ